ncbi:hypothetical protein EHS39_31095 [Ensifer sp. MPMI2T]|nr:hypothetical protein EHS39_31095 [Ensifer sp. MPMI2T]
MPSSPASGGPFRRNLPATISPSSCQTSVWHNESDVAWHVNVRMRLFQLGLAFKVENPTGRILMCGAAGCCKRENQ